MSSTDPLAPTLRTYERIGTMHSFGLMRRQDQDRAFLEGHGPGWRAWECPDGTIIGVPAAAESIKRVTTVSTFPSFGCIKRTRRRKHVFRTFTHVVRRHRESES